MFNNKKVIMIDGKNENWYDQVIFVIKNNQAKDENDLVFEAEKIVERYMLKDYIKNNSLFTYENNKKKHDLETLVNYITLLVCIVFLIAIILLLV